MTRTALSRYLLLLLLLIPASLTGCELFSEDEPDAPFRAQVAGERWIGETSINIVDGALYVHAADGDLENGNYERIRLTIVGFSGKGEYQLEEAFFDQIIGGDVASPYGDAEAAPGNVVTITRYDASSGVIHGEFRFDAVASRSFDGVEEGESFEVSGRFEGRLPGIAFQAVER